MRATDELSADERRALIASMRPADAEGVPDLGEVDVPGELREQIERAMSRYPQRCARRRSRRRAVQRLRLVYAGGHRQAAAVMGVTPAYLESVASFYDLFTEPVASHRVLVCHNNSCWPNGGDELLQAFAEAPATTSSTRVRVHGRRDIARWRIDERYYGSPTPLMRPPRSTGAARGEQVLPARRSSTGPQPSP